MVEIDDGCREVLHVGSDHVPEEHELQHGHDEQQPQQQWIATELQELLPHEQPDALEAHRARLP